MGIKVEKYFFLDTEKKIYKIITRPVVNIWIGNMKNSKVALEIFDRKLLRRI